eukprot:107816_1
MVAFQLAFFILVISNQLAWGEQYEIGNKQANPLLKNMHMQQFRNSKYPLSKPIQPKNTVEHTTNGKIIYKESVKPQKPIIHWDINRWVEKRPPIHTIWSEQPIMHHLVVNRAPLNYYYKTKVIRSYPQYAASKKVPIRDRLLRLQKRKSKYKRFNM